MKVCLGVLALLGILASGQAAAITGNEFLEMCENTLSNDSNKSLTFTAGYCAGAIQVAGDLPLPFANDSITGPKVCLPTSATNKQVTRIVVKHLKDHPESFHLNSTSLTIVALQNAFLYK